MPGFTWVPGFQGDTSWDRFMLLIFFLFANNEEALLCCHHGYNEGEKCFDYFNSFEIFPSRKENSFDAGMMPVHGVILWHQAISNVPFFCTSRV